MIRLRRKQELGRTQFRLEVAATRRIELVTVVLLLLCPMALSANPTCEELVLNPFDLYGRGLLSGDLSPLVDLAGAVCPARTTGEDATAVCTTGAASSISAAGVPNIAWNGIDFGYELQQYFTNPENFAVCESIFRNGPFSTVLRHVPQVEGKVLEKYQLLSQSRRDYGCTNDEEASGEVLNRTNLDDGTEVTLREGSPTEQPAMVEFSDFQKRIFNVLESIPSWNFCAHAETTSKGYSVLGSFDRQQRITLYKQACHREDLYGIDVSDLSQMHRGFLVAAHEFGHALAHSAGLPQSSSDDETEDKATLLGSFVAECSARLFEQLSQCYADAVVVPEIQKAYDQKFANCQVRRWSKMEGRIQQARAELCRTLSCENFAPTGGYQSDWSGQCLSYELD